MKRFLTLIVSAMAAGLLLAQSVQAAPGFDGLAYKHATDHGYYISVQGSETLGQKNWGAGLALHFMNGSIALENALGQKIRDVVGNQFTTQVFGAFGVTDWLNLGVLVDFVPYQEFSHALTGIADNGARMGDIRVEAKFRILDVQQYPVGLAFVPYVTIPTGKENRFAGHGSFTGGGEIVVESKRFQNRFSVSANVGGHLRENVILNQGTRVGHALTYGVGANYAFNKFVEAIAEIKGATRFADLFGSNYRPLVGRGGVRIFPHQNLAITAGAGAGIIKSVSAPDLEGFVNIAYTPAYKHYSPPPPPPIPTCKDADKDGVCDLEDRCPAEAGPTANCGCPEKPMMEVDADAKQIRNQKIHFEFNKSMIRPNSYGILDTIAKTIEIRPDITHVRVVGHTDSIGSDNYNQRLSEKRSKAVYDYLVNKGVPTGRMAQFGKGETEPIDTNDTDEGRAKNRRVQFDIDILPSSGAACKTK